MSAASDRTAALAAKAAVQSLATPVRRVQAKIESDFVLTNGNATGGSAANLTDVPGLSRTWESDGSTIDVIFACALITQSAIADLSVALLEDGVTIDFATLKVGVAGKGAPMAIHCKGITPAPGTRTYKIQLKGQSAGQTVTLLANALYPARLTVERA